MNEWSLPKLLAGLHEDIQHRLATARRTLAHPGTKGNASENVWRELLQTYLPRRYQSETAHVVDSQGTFSEQIDVVVFDRQYSPFIFRYEDQTIIPAESLELLLSTDIRAAVPEARFALPEVGDLSVRRPGTAPIRSRIAAHCAYGDCLSPKLRWRGWRG